MIGAHAADYEEFPVQSSYVISRAGLKRDASRLLQVNRPLSMKKDGIQTRKRKPKSMGGAHSSSVARPGSSLPGECRW